MEHYFTYRNKNHQLQCWADGAGCFGNLWEIEHTKENAFLTIVIQDRSDDAEVFAVRAKALFQSIARVEFFKNSLENIPMEYHEDEDDGCYDVNGDVVQIVFKKSITTSFLIGLLQCARLHIDIKDRSHVDSNGVLRFHGMDVIHVLDAIDHGVSALRKAKVPAPTLTAINAANYVALKAVNAFYSHVDRIDEWMFHLLHGILIHSSASDFVEKFCEQGNPHDVWASLDLLINKGYKRIIPSGNSVEEIIQQIIDETKS